MQFSLTFLAISKSFTISTFTWLVCFVGEGKCHGHITFYFYPEIFCFCFVFSHPRQTSICFSPFVTNYLSVSPKFPWPNRPRKIARLSAAAIHVVFRCWWQAIHLTVHNSLFTTKGNTQKQLASWLENKIPHPDVLSICRQIFSFCFVFFLDWNLRSSLACGAKVKQHQGAFFSRLFLVDDAAAIICFLPAGSPSKSIYGSLCASCRIPLRAEQKWKPRWLGSGLLRASLAVHFSRSKYVRNTRPRRREDERVPYGTFGTKERISRHFLFCFFLNNIFSKGFFRSKTVAVFFLRLPTNWSYNVCNLKGRNGFSALAAWALFVVEKMFILIVCSSLSCSAAIWMRQRLSNDTQRPSIFEK